MVIVGDMNIVMVNAMIIVVHKRYALALVAEWVAVIVGKVLEPIVHTVTLTLRCGWGAYISVINANVIDIDSARRSYRSSSWRVSTFVKDNVKVRQGAGR